jgi:hypothetical protein
MHYETFKFIIDNREKLLYNAATGSSTDQSIDPGAATSVDPSHYLAPVIGGSSLIKLLTIVGLVLAIAYLLKLNLRP